MKNYFNLTLTSIPNKDCNSALQNNDQTEPNKLKTCIIKADTSGNPCKHNINGLSVSPFAT